MLGLMRSFICRGIILVTSIIVFNLLVGMTAVVGDESGVLGICGMDRYITIDQMNSYCNVPGSCSRKLACEGKIVRIVGYIRYINVWSKREYPWIPYDKFFLYNSSGSSNIEVRVSSEVASEVFDKINKYGGNEDRPVYVMGLLIGIDLPIMDSCHRDLVVEVIDADGLVYTPAVP